MRVQELLAKTKRGGEKTARSGAMLSMARKYGNVRRISFFGNFKANSCGRQL
jgi:hypothetical protein